ncbi:MAG: hypothetical protein KBT19_07065 [Lachnospiraceae bacterium]|nr:hypothetical protein [Candidatus Colinaster equi]
MKIQPKNDLSMLFNSLNTSGSALSTINLADYTSIKNGSYGKLLKAYYAKDDVEPKTKDVTKDKSKTAQYSAVAAAADSVNEAAKPLLKTGSESLFNKKDIKSVDEEGKEVVTKGYDYEAIYKAVNNFADKYNTFITKAKNSSSDKVAREADSLANQMNGYYTKLREVGIEINDDDTLSVNKESLMKADIGSLKSLFDGNRSTTYQVVSKVGMIGSSAKSEANTTKGYNSSANYADSYSVGNLLNSIV